MFVWLLETEEVCFCALGRLHHSAKVYGEVFVNGAKSHMPYGSYVSSQYKHLLEFHCFY